MWGQEEAVDAAVPGCLSVVDVDAAACDDRDIGAFRDEEVVVDQVVYVGRCDACGDGDLLSLDSRLDVDVETAAVGFGRDLDLICAQPFYALSVLSDVVGAAFLLDLLPVGDQVKQFITCAHSLTPVMASRPMGQGEIVASVGSTSSLGPSLTTLPPSTTMMRSATASILS